MPTGPKDEKCPAALIGKIATAEEELRMGDGKNAAAVVQGGALPLVPTDHDGAAGLKEDRFFRGLWPPSAGCHAAPSACQW